MPPPPPRTSHAHLLLKPGEDGPPKQVLDEDEYVAHIEAIVERDYFPDIPKLRSQLEWEQAVNTGDPFLIRQAQINIARRRAGLKTPAPNTGAGAGEGGRRPHTGGTWGATPGMTQSMLRTPAMTPLPQAGASTPAVHGAGGGAEAFGATPGAHVLAARTEGGNEQAELRAPPMSLDAYLAQHTSEDNASFARLQAKTLALKRQKVAHHLEDKNKLLLEGPGSNPTEEYGTSGQQPYTLVMTKHNPTSSLYYSPQQRPLSATEAAEFARRPPKSINIKATRLKPAEVDPSQQQAPPGTLPPALARAVGLAAPANAGTPRDFNNRLPTPALTPSALGDESPFMTWGDIEGTPLRLEPEEGVAYDPKALDGPTFSVPNMPKKEQVGHELAAAKSIKELRKRQKAAKLAALFGAPPGGTPAVAAGHRLSSQPRSEQTLGGVHKARTPLLSPAAQRLVHSMHSTPKTGGTTKGGTTKRVPARLSDLTGFGSDKGANSVDAALRASYSGVRPSPSPSPFLSQRATPTPSLKRSQQPPTPSLASQGGSVPKGEHPSSSMPAAKPSAFNPQAGSITDDLLNI